MELRHFPSFCWEASSPLLFATFRKHFIHERHGHGIRGHDFIHAEDREVGEVGHAVDQRDDAHGEGHAHQDAPEKHPGTYVAVIAQLSFFTLTLWLVSWFLRRLPWWPIFPRSSRWPRRSPRCNRKCCRNPRRTNGRGDPQFRELKESIMEIKTINLARLFQYWLVCSAPHTVHLVLMLLVPVLHVLVL